MNTLTQLADGWKPSTPHYKPAKSCNVTNRNSPSGEAKSVWETKHPANHLGRFHVPSVIADLSPFAFMFHLDSPLVSVFPSDQSHLWTACNTQAQQKGNRQKKARHFDAVSVLSTVHSVLAQVLGTLSSVTFWTIGSCSRACNTNQWIRACSLARHTIIFSI